ncbi:MAG TPA: deoxynucleoside kinase [Anaerolineaceae bacterium]|nr:deoxynucleoside kinase [Anaerolineaceae bacterium]
MIVVGNSGVGKTTLTRLLCEQGGFAAGLEQIGERPYQQLFAADLTRYALPNQVDFLLFRAEQEIAIRRGTADGILDGGLEEDYFIFTRHFYRKGYLTPMEYSLCERLVTNLRQLLPEPDLILALNAPIPVIAERYARRGRILEITRRSDLEELEGLLREFVEQQDPSRVIQFDASRDDPTYAEVLPGLIEQIRARLTDQGEKWNPSKMTT